MILVWLMAIPFIGGFLCWQGERFGRGFPRWVGLITMSTVLGISLYLWVTGDYSQTLLSTSNPHWVEEFRARWEGNFRRLDDLLAQTEEEKP